MRKWMWLAAAAVIVAVVVFVVVTRRAGDSSAPTSDAAPSVQMASVKYGPYAVVLDESGHVGAPAGTTSQLAFPNPGILRELYVHVGEHVSVGEALAALDTRPLSLAEQQASADAQAASAQASAAAIDKYSMRLALDRASVTREERLFNAGVAAQKDVQAAREQLAADEADAQSASANRIAAQAQAASALAKAELAKTDLSKATLRSPVDGIVTAIMRRAGESVDSTTPVVSIGPPQQAEVTLQVPSSDAQQIAVGDAVELQVAGSSGAGSGTVRAIVPAVDPVTQAATVVVAGVPAGAVAGSAVRARITVARVNGLLVPQSAIVQDPQSGDDVIFAQERQKDGSMKFVQHTVTVAHEDGTTAELSSGVRAGERIAAQGAFELLAPAGGGD